MKKIEIEVPEGKKAEWVNGVLTLVDEKPIKYKFKVGDKVRAGGQNYKITDAIAQCGKPAYRLEGLVGIVYEGQINGYAPKGITERIKTFDDAEDWCSQNKPELCRQWRDYCNAHDDDVEAYLKLRIITAALNEGWEPKFEDGEERWYICADEEDCGGPSICRSGGVIMLTESSRLLFKNDTLAEYASKQFLDLYRDFCGCKKGGE